MVDTIRLSQTAAERSRRTLTDKGHAASIILSTTLLILLLVLFLIGAFVERPWIADALTIIGTAFTFTAGVAIGKGSEASKRKDD